MTKIIPLTREKQAIVDDGDYDMLVAMGKWMAFKGNGGWYAARNRSMREKRSGMAHFIFMHNVILSPPLGMTVDHIDRNGLNNIRSNMRFATKSQQVVNRELQSSNKSGYRGVSFDKERGKWSAEIRSERKRIHLGRFETIIQAALAYDVVAIILHGEFAQLNIIGK